MYHWSGCQPGVTEPAHVDAWHHARALMDCLSGAVVAGRQVHSIKAARNNLHLHADWVDLLSLLRVKYRSCLLVQPARSDLAGNLNDRLDDGIYDILAAYHHRTVQVLELGSWLRGSK